MKSEFLEVRHTQGVGASMPELAPDSAPYAAPAESPLKGVPDALAPSIENAEVRPRMPAHTGLKQAASRDFLPCARKDARQLLITLRRRVHNDPARRSERPEAQH